jgi:hypothetical protein
MSVHAACLSSFVSLYLSVVVVVVTTTTTSEEYKLWNFS